MTSQQSADYSVSRGRDILSGTFEVPEDVKDTVEPFGSPSRATGKCACFCRIFCFDGIVGPPS